MTLLLVLFGLGLGWLISPAYCPDYAGLARPVTACFHPDLWTGRYTYPADDPFVRRQSDGTLIHEATDPQIQAGAEREGAPSVPPGILFEAAGVVVVTSGWVAWRSVSGYRYKPK
jgi:hypothetical protein